MSDNKYLIDTDIAIDLLKARYRLWDKIIDVGISNCYISEVSIAELHFGVYYSARRQEHRNEPSEIADALTVLPISEALELFGREKARLTKQGSRIPDFDLLIATTSVHYGCILVTGNGKHLARVEGVTIENWREPAFNRFI